MSAFGGKADIARTSLECALGAGQDGASELTVGAGLSKDESHGPTTSLRQHRVQTAGRTGVHCRRDFCGLSKRHDLAAAGSGSGFRKYEVGALDEDARAADLLQKTKRVIAALERMVGRQALEIEFLKGALKTHHGRETRIHPSLPSGTSIAEGCRLMGFGRSTFYDIPDVRARDLTIVAEMKAICDEFEAYGYRRVDAELRHRGIVVNTKKISSAHARAYAQSKAAQAVYRDDR